MKKLFSFSLIILLFGVASAQLYIRSVATSPVIDGVISGADPWTGSWNKLNKAWLNNTTSAMSAEFQMCYDNINLYLVVRVNDPTPDSSSLNTWENDCVEVYLSMDTNSGEIGSYKTGDWQFRKQWAKNIPRGLMAATGDINFGQQYGYDIALWLAAHPGFNVVEVDGSASYVQEWQMPWSALTENMDPAWVRNNFKFDIQATDNTTDLPGGRTQLQFWHSNSDEQWHNTKYFGFVQMDSVVVVPPDSVVIPPDSGHISPAFDLNIYKTPVAPTINGIIDGNDPWSDTWIELTKSALLNTTSDMSARFQMCYDNNNLYIIAQVNDPTQDSSCLSTWENDCIELYLAMDTNSGEYGFYKTGDWQIRKQWGKNVPGGLLGYTGDVNYGIQYSYDFGQWLAAHPKFKVAETTGNASYIQEWQVPWSDITENMNPNWDLKEFKFDIQAADNTTDSPGGRTQLQFWHSNSDEQWHNTKYFGKVALNSSIITPPDTGHISPAVDLTIYKTPVAPTINGIIDGSDPWYGNWIELDQSKLSNTTSDMSARFQMCYDNKNLYMVAQVNDPTQDSSSLSTWENDCIELYLAMDTNSGEYGFYKTGDWQFRKQWGKNIPGGLLAGTGDVNYSLQYGYDIGQWLAAHPEFKVAETDSNDTYIQEWQVPWLAITENMDPNWDQKIFKFDIQATDNTTDSPEGRTQLQFWHSNSDEQWHNTKYFGIVALDSGIGHDTTHFFTEQICQVSVDDLTGKNVLYWERTPDQSIKEYNIYKETTVRDVYSKIGTQPFSSEGRFIDQGSNPSRHADRYKIETTLMNNQSGGMSYLHQTIHLAISSSTAGRYNLNWTPYYGFDFSTYFIYRGSSPTSLELIDSISSNQLQYTDKTNGKVYYRIAVRKTNPCKYSNLKSAVVTEGSVSNTECTEDALKVPGSEMINVRVTPNPFTDYLTIQGDLVQSSAVRIEIFNLMGAKIFEYSTNASGSFKKVIHVNELNFASTINVLKVTIGETTRMVKIIKK